MTEDKKFRTIFSRTRTISKNLKKNFKFPKKYQDGGWPKKNSINFFNIKFWIITSWNNNKKLYFPKGEGEIFNFAAGWFRVVLQFSRILQNISKLLRKTVFFSGQPPRSKFNFFLRHFSLRIKKNLRITVLNFKKIIKNLPV